MNKSLVRLGLVLALSACSGSTNPLFPRVTLTPTRTLYAAGETISATLANRSDDEIGYGACAVSLERLVDTRWTVVSEDQRICISILYVLARGDTKEVRLPLDLTLAPGAYRLRHEFLPGTSLPKRYVHSRAFRVE